MSLGCQVTQKPATGSYPKPVNYQHHNSFSIRVWVFQVASRDTTNSDELMWIDT